MKIILKYIFLLSLCSINTFAQKEGNVWCFPDHAGIDFNNITSPDTFTSSIGSMGLGYPLGNQCSIADSSGNLFCYASAIDLTPHGLYLWDRDHNVMPNGNNLQGHPNFTSLLIAQPDRDSLIYLFHIGIDTVNTNYYRLFYSIINKNLNNGLGDVVAKNTLLYYAGLSDHKLSAVKHANGRDWWIFVYDFLVGEYVKFIFTPGGVFFNGEQTIGSSNICMYFGRIVFSTDGTKMMSVGVYQGCIDVFDFDRCTGILSNFRDVGEHLATADSLQYEYYNCEFSPSGNLIYVSPWSFKKVFYQWNLNAGDITAIRASKVLLNEYADTGMVQWNVYQHHILAPDGKIYIPVTSDYQGPNIDNYYTRHLDVIENPDVPGIGCNYVRQGFDLGNHFIGGDLPNIPHFGLGAVTASICDSLTGVQSLEAQSLRLEVYPNPSQGIFSLSSKDKTDKIVSAKVEDILGNEILSVKNFSSVIDIGDQPAGIYFVHAVTQKKKMFVVKVVKE